MLAISFLEVEWSAEFDGVWACASLVHMPRNQIAEAVIRLAKALKPGGIFYASFKPGDGEVFRDGRLFNNYNHQSFARLIACIPELDLVEVWFSEHVRPERQSEMWLNTILSKRDQRNS